MDVIPIWGNPVPANKWHHDQTYTHTEYSDMCSLKDFAVLGKAYPCVINAMPCTMNKAWPWKAIDSGKAIDSAKNSFVVTEFLPYTCLRSTTSANVFIDQGTANRNKCIFSKHHHTAPHCRRSKRSEEITSYRDSICNEACWHNRADIMQDQCL